MLRALIAFAMLVLLLPGLPAHAQTSCAPAKTDALWTRERSCPEEIRKVSCGGTSIDLMAGRQACCQLRPSKAVSWRCGTDEALSFKCKGAGKNAALLSVTKTSSGVRFVCLGEKAPPPEITPPANLGNTEGEETSASED